MSLTPQKLPNRPLIKFGGFRKLRLKERLLILIGYNLTCSVEVVVDRRNSRVLQRCYVSITKETEAAAQARLEQEAGVEKGELAK
jgi:hypothetical protein